MKFQSTRGGDEAVEDGRNQATAQGQRRRSLCPESSVSEVVQVRQVNVIIGTDPSATISSLSSALETASASISKLSAANQQLQFSSVGAVASAQAAQAALQVSVEVAAQIAASSMVASVSSSAAAAVASASNSANMVISSASSAVADASAMVLEASQSADAARAEASLVRVSSRKLPKKSTVGR